MCASQATRKNALPLIDAQRARGLQTAAWGQLTGSRVAAEVSLSLPRATDITDEWLDGAMRREVADAEVRYDMIEAVEMMAEAIADRAS